MASDTADLVGVLIQIGFYVVFYGTLGSVVLWVSWREYARRRKLKKGGDLSAFAKGLGGEVVRGGHEFPFVRFERRGLRGFFVKWVIGSSDVIVSGFEICAGSDAFLEATSQPSRRVLTRFPRAREIEGVPAFRTSTTDASWAGRLLDLGLARLLQELRSEFAAPVRVQLTPARIRMEIERTVESHEGPMFLGALDRLLDLLGTGVDPRGVQILATSFDPRNGRCPVCGGGVKDGHVLCKGCRAPHHADCFGYLGACGVFGCGQRQTTENTAAIGR